MVGSAGVAAKCQKGALVGARGTSKAEVDPVWVQLRQSAELFSDYEWRVVGEHDAAGAQADARRVCAHVGNKDRRGG